MELITTPKKTSYIYSLFLNANMPNNHGHVMSHIHQRKIFSQNSKQKYKEYEPYPHPEKWKRKLDKSIYTVSVIGLAMTIPQITKIWIEHNASGVSLIAWSTYVFTAFVWLMYGIAHKEKPIILTNIAWIFVNVIIVIGIIMYG